MRPRDESPANFRAVRLSRVALLALALASLALRPATASAAPEPPCPDLDHQYERWSALLARRVRDGVVDYAGILAAESEALGAIQRDFEAVCPQRYQSWTRPQKLAFWINAYNVYTIRLILDHYPVTSIRSIGFLPGAAFRRSFIPIRASGETSKMSLDDIEHDILRPEFREPRIHFAIVCAAKGCPVLRSESYRAESLDEQLNDAARGFVRDPAKNRYDREASRLYLSSIFKWFRQDFEGEAGTLYAFVARHADPEAAALSSDATPRIEFLDYDWSLNGH